MISFFYPGGCNRQRSDSFKNQQVLKAFFIKQEIHLTPYSNPLGWDASISKPPARRVLILGSTQNISHDIDVHVSGVSDPEKASDLVVKKLQRMLTDRYYHQKLQER